MKKFISSKKILKISIISVILVILIPLSISLIIDIRENTLKKGIDIQVKYDADNCYLNLTHNNIKLKREQVNTFIEGGREYGLDSESVLDGLIFRGYELEGIDSNMVKEIIKTKQAISVIINNNTNKTLEKVSYDIGVRRIGYSTDISSYDLHSLTSDKILKPGEEANFCITKNLKDIDRGFIKTPEKFEFFTKNVRPEFY